MKNNIDRSKMSSIKDTMETIVKRYNKATTTKEEKKALTALIKQVKAAKKESEIFVKDCDSFISWASSSTQV